jgi:N-acetylmuramoyl-L-alanine amidase
MTPRIALLLLLCLLASCTSPTRTSSGRSEHGDRPGPSGFRTVVVDAGHGGHDSGAPGRLRGMPEKTLALDIANRLRRALSPSFRVVMTRQGDYDVPLESRVTVADRSGDAVLVSIHLNSGPRSLTGAETYWWRVDSYSLARRTHAALCSVVPGSNNRGMTRRRLRLTRNPDIPCILVECGYLSNSRDAVRLADPRHRERVAQALADAIRQQARLGDAGMGPLPAPLYAPPSRASDARE